MTQRAPLYTKIAPREYPNGLLTWTNGVQLGIQPTPAIQRQQDWQNPNPKPPNLQLRIWTNGLPPGVIANPIPPIENKDWPNPYPKAPNLELRNWSNGLPPGIIANQTPPIRNYDWQNPTLRTQSHVNRTWTWSQQIPQPVGTKPFSQSEWPNPKGPQFPSDLRGWSNWQQLDNGPQAFIPQTDWPLPQPKRANLELRTWSNALPPGVIANQVPPIRNYDWQNPTLAKIDLRNRTWIYSQQIVPIVVAPFVQSDWPNPTRRLDTSQLRTWVNGVQLANPVLPISQTDWPNPKVRTSHDLRTWSNSLPPGTLANQTPPNEWREWSNPAPKPQNLELRSWRNGLPPGAISQPTPPIRNYDWPNPKPKAPNLELRAWINGFSVIYAPVVPPYVEDTRVIVPYLIGSTAAHATQMLASVHLLIDVIGTTGTVTAQDVTAFTLVARGTTVTVTLGGAINNPKKGGPHGLPDYTLPN